MINATIHLDDDSEVCEPIWLRSLPRVGEFIWISGGDRQRVIDRHGTSSFTVTAVAHWCGPTWQPSTHDGEPNHSVCLYVAATPPHKDG
jgi:hypothetical protein